jgi:ATP-dependent DNA helicase DinG
LPLGSAAGDPDFIDWLAVDRVDGREFDIGIHRRWLDPTRPLAETVLKPAHGVIVTSATLRGWRAGRPRRRAQAPATSISPSSTSARTARSTMRPTAKCLIVTDLKRGDVAQLAGAYSRLIEAAGGGTLGLFTAIQRLKAVHARIADRLARAGLPLYAQHVDRSTPALWSISSATIRALPCSGTGCSEGRRRSCRALAAAGRDGRGFPGHASDGCCTPARRAVAGGSGMTTRWCGATSPGFGRLIREARTGMFVLLSARPRRAAHRLPPASMSRLSLNEALERVRSRLSSETAFGHQETVTAA